MRSQVLALDGCRACHATLVALFAMLALSPSSGDDGAATQSGPGPWLERPGTRFVSPEGSDDTPGTEDRPWRTLQWSIDHLSPGDVLVLESGVYPERLRLALTGTADEPIIIRAREPGAAVIDGGGETTIRDSDAGLAHVVMSGLHIRNAACGFDLDAPIDHLTLSDCTIADCRHAFICEAGGDLQLRHVRVEDCDDGIGLGVKGRSGIAGVEISDCAAIREADAEADRNTDGFRVEGLCTDVHISGCEAAGFDDSGFDIKPDAAVIERCLAHHNWDNGFKLWGDGARLINCIARDNDDTGVTLAAAAHLYHCTIVFNRRAALRPEADDISRIVLRNCIIAYNFIRQYLARGGPGVYDDDHNLYYAPGDDLIWKIMDRDRGPYTLHDLRRGALPIGEHSIFADPRFVSVEARDLRLRADSPAVGAGLPLDFVTVDFAGNPRGDAPDLGAFQRQ